MPITRAIFTQLGATDAVPETVEASLQLSEAALVGLGNSDGTGDRFDPREARRNPPLIAGRRAESRTQEDPRGETKKAPPPQGLSLRSAPRNLSRAAEHRGRFGMQRSS